jgi:hypothetical protein
MKLIALLLLSSVSTAAVADPLADYKAAQQHTFSGCTMAFDTALQKAQEERTPLPSVVALDAVSACTKKHGDEVKARYRTIAETLPSQKEKDALTNIQVAYMAILPTLPMQRRAQDNARLDAAMSKFHEAWARFELSH